MRPIYDPYIHRWLVKGLGYFDSRAEAQAAIENNTMSDALLIRIDPKTKQQLQDYAKIKDVSVSDLIRHLIDKEVNNNG